MSSGGAALQPTFTGHVATTQDALILFEACLQGHLSHVPRRPHDRERASLIRSGSVFIYEENASGIKRWTDGVTWSPSRILGNFLVYRELDKPFPPGEKKRAMKKQNRRSSRPGEPYARPERPGDGYSPTQPGYGSGDRPATDIERQLIGSLIDSYGFKADGLVKKTMSVTVQGVTHHLVSYYNVNDVVQNNLRTPAQTDTLQYIRPRPELTSKQSFRSPIEEVDEVDGLRDGQAAYGYRLGPSGYVHDYRQQQYYMPQQYPPMASQPPLQTSFPPSVPPMTSPYLHTPVQTPHLPQDRSPYDHYAPGGIGRGYEPLNSNMSSGQKSVPPTPTSAISAPMPDRNQPQNMMYPPPGVQRPMSAVSPVSMDSRNNMPYRSGYTMPPVSSPVDSQRPPQQSPVHLKYEERRESQGQATQNYPAPRSGYYPENPPQNMAQSSYQHPAAPLGQQWNGQHPQQ